MNYLFVVAHPDDEVLGAGATIYKLSSLGHNVDVCILSGEVKARENRPQSDELLSDSISAMNIIGVHSIYRGDFPNIEFNIVPHIKLVQFIENIISKTNAEVIFTHHPSDLNNDHYNTSIACQAAIRLFQRRSDITPIREVLFMEVPSSTEWGINTSVKPFSPNTFVEIGEIGIKKKLEALGCYRGVMRDYPHPRSVEAITGLASYRGGQSGQKYAESFESVFRREL